jgi:hypothetical protein
LQPLFATASLPALTMPSLIISSTLIPFSELAPSKLPPTLTKGLARRHHADSGRVLAREVY